MPPLGLSQRSRRLFTRKDRIKISPAATGLVPVEADLRGESCASGESFAPLGQAQRRVRLKAHTTRKVKVLSGHTLSGP